MGFTVQITEQAEDDLADIYSYILSELKSSINADAVLGRLYTEINNLSFMADGYHLSEAEAEAVRESFYQFRYSGSPYLLRRKHNIHHRHCTACKS